MQSLTQVTKQKVARVCYGLSYFFWMNNSQKHHSFGLQSDDVDYEHCDMLS